MGENYDEQNNKRAADNNHKHKRQKHKNGNDKQLDKPRDNDFKNNT